MQLKLPIGGNSGFFRMGFWFHVRETFVFLTLKLCFFYVKL